MPRIVLHIDRLVLRGVDRADAAAVSDALQAALRVQLAAQGIAALAAHAAVPRLRAGRVPVPQGGGGAALGQAVGTRIAAGGMLP